MAHSSLLHLLIIQCKYGIVVEKTKSTSIEDTMGQYIVWHGLLTVSVSLPGDVIIQYRYGMQLQERTLIHFMDIQMR
jgi:hypothetical protein